MPKQSLLKTLFQRRVPQILGLYIAATWMMIEIGDWMVERFAIMPEITSYIFIGMVFFVPSVCYLAYQYGQPGPDPWKKPTFVVVPTNLVIAIVAMFYLVNPVIATETKIIVDETGQQRSFEVAKEGYRKNLVSFFWRNKSGDKEIDWLQYGLPYLLSRDLNRSLFISSYTPFDKFEIFRELQASGFQNALRVPNSLQINIARENFDQYVLNGFYEKNNQQLSLTVELFRANSGEKVATHQVQGEDFLSLIDELTIAIKSTLEVPETLADRTSDLPVAEHISESKIAIRKRVESNVKLFVDNDYASAKKLLEEAVAEDFSYAEAYGRLARVNQLMGNGREAAQALTEALKHEYKFTRQGQFRYKAMTYGMRGDYTSQVKVYDMWLEIEPENIEALERSSELLMITGIDSDKALNHLIALRELKPTDHSVLRKLANLYLLRDQLDKAIESLTEFNKLQANDVDALNQLAELYQRNSQFDKAKTTLEKNLLFQRGNIAAEMKLAKIELKMGETQAAEERLNQLLAAAQNNPEKYLILNGLLKHYSTLGQINKSIEVMDQMTLYQDHLPPLLQIFQIQFPKSLYLANLGQYDVALDILSQAQSQLQPPLDGIIDVGIVNVYIIKKETTKVEEYIAKIDAYLEKYPNPLFLSIMDGAKAELAELKKDYELSTQLHARALKASIGNIVNTQDEDVVLTQKAKLAGVQFKTEAKSEAFEILQGVIKQHPYFPQAHLTLAEYYLELGNLEKAKSSAQKAAVIFQNADTEYTIFQRLESVQERIKLAE